MLPSLQNDGYVVEAVDFPSEPETKSSQTYIELQAKALARRIHELQIRSGSPKVILVCHSMGGLAARWYLTNPNLWVTPGNSGVAKLIMLGTPNLGTDSTILDPVVTQSLSCDYPRSANDLPATYQYWCPAIQELFAEWQPAPLKTSNVYAYPLGFKLGKWQSINGEYVSPIKQVTSYALAAKVILDIYDPFNSDAIYAVNSIDDVVSDNSRVSL